MKLLALSGLIPEQICDVVRFTGDVPGTASDQDTRGTGRSEYARERGVAHYCGYAEDYISAVRQDDTVDGAVFPKSCDSSRIMANYLEDCGKFLYQLNIPARQDELAVEFFAAQLEQYREAVERHFGRTIADVAERTEAVNARNREIRKVYANLEGVSYRAYLDSIHEMLTKPLSEQVVKKDLPVKKGAGKRVYLVGSFLADTEIAGVIEDCGLTVVGDDLPESGRLAAMPEADPGGELYREIAACVLRGRLSPTQDNFRQILLSDMKEIEEKKTDGVIFVTQKYCEPYDYLFSVYKKMLDQRGIQATQITLADSGNERKARLALEAFADVI